MEEASPGIWAGPTSHHPPDPARPLFYRWVPGRTDTGWCLSHLPSLAPTHPRDWGCGEGGGGGSELPASRPGLEGAEPPSRRAGGRGGGSLAGEELGEGSEAERRAREGELGEGAAGRREVERAKARAREEPPRAAGPGAPLGVAAMKKRPPARRQGTARGRGPARARPRSAPACPEAGKRLEPGGAREGVRGPRSGSQFGRPGVSWSGRWRSPPRPAGPGVPPLSTFGREGHARKRGPRGPAQLEGRVGGAVRSPRMEGGPRQHPGGGCGIPAKLFDCGERDRDLAGPGAATPPRGPRRRRETRRRPLSARSQRRGAAPLCRGVGGASSGEPRLPD